LATRIRWSFCVLALVLGLCVARAQPADGPDEWLTFFNRQRGRAGLPGLRPLPVLTEVAQQVAEEWAGKGWRYRSSGREVAERLQRVGYSAHDWREGFAFADSNPEKLLDRLPAAMDGHFQDVGVGTALGADGSTLHVFLFGWHEGDYFAAATARLRDRARITSEMLARVNEARRQAGRAPLLPSPLLDKLSQEHAEDMLARSYSGHWTPEGQSPSDRARAAGYPSGIAENLVEQRFSATEAFEAWLASPGHRQNLLDPDCREMGLGLAIGAGYDAAPGGYRVIWVQSCGRGDSGR
jgi:uncharacterized protein YkwD